MPEIPLQADYKPRGGSSAFQKPSRQHSPLTPRKRKKYDYDPSDWSVPHPLHVIDYSIAVDTSEQLPYHFTGIVADDCEDELIIPLSRQNLMTGDYSIVGCESLITSERKSLSDFLGSITAGRERFEREFERMNEMHVAYLIIEASRDEAMTSQLLGKISAKTITETERSWTIKYPTVHWVWAGNRVLAEIETYRNLSMFWRIWSQK